MFYTTCLFSGDLGDIQVCPHTLSTGPSLQVAGTHFIQGTSPSLAESSLHSGGFLPETESAGKTGDRFIAIQPP